MAQVMYFDCFSGAAGDMLLAALLDAGLPIEALRAALGSLGVDHHVEISRTARCGLAATRFEVHGPESATPAAGGLAHAHPHGPHDDQTPPHHHPPGHDHRTLDEIARLIGQSALPAAGKARAVALFERLGGIEAAIHGTTRDQVHLHEVGALDSIIDIVGFVSAMDWFGIEQVEASPLNVGGGTVSIAHGTFPVPAPATLRLLEGVPIYSAGPRVELVTPTGALLVSDYARRFGPLPAMTVRRIGYGAGTRDTPETPNVVRVVIGETTGDRQDGEVLKLECEIDDMSPQLLGLVIDGLLEAGALDAFLTPVMMKKGRPGTLVTALVPPARRETVTTFLFRETTTIGVRVEGVARETLARRWDEVHVEGRPIRIKVATRGGAVLNAAAEFDDCLQAAKATGTPVKQVQAEAMAAWLAERPRH